MLLYSDRIIAATFYSGVVGYDHALNTIKSRKWSNVVYQCEL